jgi:hypothetical protein
MESENAGDLDDLSTFKKPKSSCDKDLEIIFNQKNQKKGYK